MAPRKKTRGQSRGRRERGLGVLFWVCLAVIAVAVAVAARGPIGATFRQLTGTAITPAPTVTVAPIAPSTTPPSSSRTEKSAPQSSTQQPVSQLPAAPKATTKQQTSTPTPAATRTARLFFATVDTQGRIAMKSVIRSVPATDSPLRDTLVSLLKGPTAAEPNLGMISMIPVAARLRGVTMNGDVAMVDFEEGFRQNPLGIDAMTTQVRQVVYAATEFSSVKSVQILIEGRKVDYLGPEGVRIDKPLSRDSFQDQPG